MAQNQITVLLLIEVAVALFEPRTSPRGSGVALNSRFLLYVSRAIYPVFRRDDPDAFFDPDPEAFFRDGEDAFVLPTFVLPEDFALSRNTAFARLDRLRPVAEVAPFPCRVGHRCTGAERIKGQALLRSGVVRPLPTSMAAASNHDGGASSRGSSAG